MTQTEAVLHYMQEFGGITPQDAMNVIGCFRLSARIYELREQGYKIKTENKRFKTRLGRVGSYAEYSLVENDG